MLLTGNVREVKRAIAKRTGVVIEEKRSYTLTISSAHKPAGYYDYGSMHFVAHGHEIGDLGIDLGTEVEIVVHRKGDDYTVKDYEVARAELSAAIQERDKARDAASSYVGRLDAAELNNAKGRTQIQALQQENVRLLTELTTLKMMLQAGDFPKAIEG